MAKNKSIKKNKLLAEIGFSATVTYVRNVGSSYVLKGKRKLRRSCEATKKQMHVGVYACSCKHISGCWVC